MKSLIDEAQIQAAVVQLAKKIAEDYRDRPLTILGVLTGSIVLLSDLIRKIDLPIRVGLIQTSSYQGRQTEPGQLKINTELLPDLGDRDVLLVDDIFDTGKTLAGLSELIRSKNTRSLRSAVLLWKENRQTVDIVPDYFCFKIPDVFVVGYGLDYNDEYRHFPNIVALEPEDL